MNTVIDTIIDGGGATRFDVFWAESSERVIIKLWDLETLENFVRQSFEGDDEKDEIFEERERTLIARVRELEAGLAEYGRHKSGCPGRTYPTCACGFAALAGETAT